MKSFLKENGVVILALLILIVGALLFANGWVKVEPKQVACTEEAKICPDGSAVGRTAPNCEFAPCPETPNLPLGYTLENYTVEKTIGGSCTKHADCTVPGEYALQSRCPFVSLCLENSCAVVCPSRINAVVFRCDQGKNISAKFYPGNDTRVDLTLSDGRTLSIPHAISASGARYATPDESFVFWNKGDTAFITEGEHATYENCVIDETSSWKVFDENGVSFKYPETLGTEFIHPTDWPPKVQIVNQPFSCRPGGSEIARAGKTEKATIADHAYCITRESEGAAGSVYTMYAYAFPKNEKTAILTFRTRAVQCDNYDNPQKSACKSERISFDINTIADQMAQSLIIQ